MKKIVLLNILVVVSILNIYSITTNININNVNISIIVDELPPNNKLYSYNKCICSINDQKLIIKKITNELNKYPGDVLKKYAPQKIYIVNSIYSNKRISYNGLSIHNNLILKKNIFIGELSAYNIRLLHHEMFHQLTKNKYDINTYKLYREIEKNSSFKYTNNAIEENDVYAFKSEFVTTYHPDASETAAEIFSYLMYVSDFDPHNTHIIKWYNFNCSNNIKLKKNIAAVINFTAAISHNIMNNGFYLNLITLY